MLVRGHSGSLKLVQFESLGAVFYSLSIVTVAVAVAVCEILVSLLVSVMFAVLEVSF